MANIIITKGRLGFQKSVVLTLAATAAFAGLVVLAKERPVQSVSPPAGNERFEVISIRQSIPDRNLPVGARGGGGGSTGCIGLPEIDPGRIVFNAVSLYTLISHAYGLVCLDVGKTGRISGGPEWARSDKWVVQALSPQGTQFDTSVMVAPFRAIPDLRLRSMLQNLLADRFKLSIHRETKEMPIYALSVAKAGPKLDHPENVPCTARGDRPFVPLNPGQRPYCTLEGKTTLSDLAAALRDEVDRPVIDRTGLTGTYEFHLLYSPPNRPTNDPSLFTAVEEQLGLKIESTKGPVEILVIDSVEKPTEN